MPISRSLSEAVSTVIPRRQARVIEEHLNSIGIYDLHDVRGAAIPAHVGTDLRGVTPHSVDKLEKIVCAYGGRLVR